MGSIPERAASSSWSAASFRGGGWKGEGQRVTAFRVAIPSQLVSYTKARAVTVEVAAREPRLADVFTALDAHYPGIRFRFIDEAGRVRPHMQIFVGNRVERDPAAPLAAGDEIMIVGALSGG